MLPLCTILGIAWRVSINLPKPSNISSVQRSRLDMTSYLHGQKRALSSKYSVHRIHMSALSLFVVQCGMAWILVPILASICIACLFQWTIPQLDGFTREFCSTFAVPIHQGPFSSIT